MLWLSISLERIDECDIIFDEVPVAQWIERVPPEHETAGSSPVGDATESHTKSPALPGDFVCELSVKFFRIPGFIVRN